MSGVPTQDGANYLLNLWGNSEQPVANYYIALITGDRPGVASAGDELDEPAVSDYARAVYENSSANWFVLDGLLVNQEQIDFGLPDEDWGTVQYWAICDSDVGGRVFFVGEVDPYQVLAGEIPSIPSGALSITLDLPSWQDDTE